MAAAPGFEPGLKDPKSLVLPLHNAARHVNNYSIWFLYRQLRNGIPFPVADFSGFMKPFITLLVNQITDVKTGYTQYNQDYRSQLENGYRFLEVNETDNCYD